MTEHNLAALRANITKNYPTPWAIEAHRTDSDLCHVIDANDRDVAVSIRHVKAEIIVALVNAYDRGELVPAHSVEAAKTALKNTFKKEARGGKVLVSVPAMELAVDRAFDAITRAQAALRGNGTCE